MGLFMGVVFVGILVLSKWVDSYEFGDSFFNKTEGPFFYGTSATLSPTPLMIGLTLIPGAAAKRAVCLDGTLPGYHIHPGSGVVDGVTLSEVVFTAKPLRHDSSKFMEKQIPFTGILSNKAEDNPDFFNWNRVKVRYCDEFASFTGDSENKGEYAEDFRSVHRLYGSFEEVTVAAVVLQFAAGHGLGMRIWEAAMAELMSKGMRNAQQLQYCTAMVLHFVQESSTKVKCLSDAGLFMDATDVSGGARAPRFSFQGVVSLQGLQKTLPSTCTNQLDPTSVQSSLAPPVADPHGLWHDCKRNNEQCSASQIQFLQGFRNDMLNAIKGFAASTQNGLFINSCFAHCQSERQDTWFADDSPLIDNKLEIGILIEQE
ncbi:hypothetical protein HAX54_050793 [Datura stramonium]|uniref:Pectin acetylesterase n=1 Tax=Datura stramonium TaxID=4076 RepID=A0ABS8WQK2_DATST|nr:hypothetical protein [Datura stramonium]